MESDWTFSFGNNTTGLKKRKDIKITIDYCRIKNQIKLT